MERNRTAKAKQNNRTNTDSANSYTYICIDLKSYYASVECVSRGLDPLKANLLVADESRSDQTICLAVSPSLKAIGVPSRPRLFEAKQAIKRYESIHHTRVDYIIAVPRMAEYIRVSALIYSIYLRYIAAEDIHVYSIDECFIDCTGYLHLYEKAALLNHTSPARLLAMTILQDVLKTTGITATVGIRTNLYLAKVAMDIVAKKAPADKDGVRIAELSEETYRYLLWEHKPLTDFWQIGPGKARRLASSMLLTMGDIAEKTQYNEEYFYKTFGIDGEILIDHAWGIEPVTMADIKNYRSDSHSLSNGQVLPRPYKYEEALLVFKEMIDGLCTDMVVKSLTAEAFSWWVSYDYKSLEAVPGYNGPLSIDFYGRVHPKHSGGGVKLLTFTNSVRLVTEAMVPSFEFGTDHRLLFRRLGVCADRIVPDEGIYQLDLFTDYDALDKERRIQNAMLKVRQRYGANAIFKGSNLIEASTTLERNRQIGGHRA
ncbi:MAG: DNA methylase [Lachnospiraceae bacterium]|nr:DNA methylase [Lachnospiraceae bacterium]